MHKICDREVKTTGMETAGNQWGGTNFRKRFINFKKNACNFKKIRYNNDCVIQEMNFTSRNSSAGRALHS